MNKSVQHSEHPMKDLVLLFTRVIVGYMFLVHGTVKLFAFPQSMTNGKPAVEWMTLMGLGGMLEIIGGVLLILGLFTRINAFIMAGMMAVAYFYFGAVLDKPLNPTPFS